MLPGAIRYKCFPADRCRQTEHSTRQENLEGVRSMFLRKRRDMKTGANDQAIRARANFMKIERRE